MKILILFLFLVVIGYVGGITIGKMLANHKSNKEKKKDEIIKFVLKSID